MHPGTEVWAAQRGASESEGCHMWVPDPQERSTADCISSSRLNLSVALQLYLKRLLENHSSLSLPLSSEKWDYGIAPENPW